MGKIDFGVFMPVYGGMLRGVVEKESEPSFNYVKQVALTAEEFGFNALWIPDHLLNPRKGANAKCPEAWTLMAALAPLTRRIRLGNTCLCNSFRHPSVLAKMAATLDEISNGRLIFSIGAGWFKQEYDAYGVPWDEHDVRIEKEKEAVILIKKLWTEPVVNFKGKYYRLENGYLEPKPLQKPYPPIWVAGNSPATMEVVCEVADGWLMSGGPPEKIKEKINSVKQKLDAKDKHIKYAVCEAVFLGLNHDDAIEKAKPFLENPKTLEFVGGIVGSPEECKDKIEQYINAGVDHLQLIFPQTQKEIQLFGEKVMPYFK